MTCSIYQNTAVIKLVSKDDFEEMEHEFLIRTFCSGKIGLPFEMLRCSQKFPLKRGNKLCPIYFSAEFSGLFW